MRQIKFRGLNKAGVWVYGDLIQTKPNKVDGGFTCWIKERGFLGLGSISTPTAAFVEVENKTVGQFIGIQDKSGREIYEGDIFGAEISIGKGRCASHHVVMWHDSGFMGKQIGTYGAYIGIAYYTQNIGNPYVVIGNIHQNPELLEQNDE